MIEINLLPEDLRVREKPITGMRLVLFLGIPFLCVLVFFWVWLRFFQHAQAEKKLKDLTSREQELKIQADEVNKQFWDRAEKDENQGTDHSET